MDAETQRRIFEPFFTTKPSGRGPGWGSRRSTASSSRAGATSGSTASRPGHHVQGLPAPRRRAGGRVGASAPPRAPATSDRILLVEDDPGVRGLMAELLEVHGSGRGTPGRGPRHVRRRARRTAGHGRGHARMRRKDLARRLLALRPGLRALYVSGFAADALTRQGMLARRPPAEAVQRRRLPRRCERSSVQTRPAALSRRTNRRRAPGSPARAATNRSSRDELLGPQGAARVPSPCLRRVSGRSSRPWRTLPMARGSLRLDNSPRLSVLAARRVRLRCCSTSGRASTGPRARDLGPAGGGVPPGRGRAARGLQARRALRARRLLVGGPWADRRRQHGALPITPRQRVRRAARGLAHRILPARVASRSPRAAWAPGRGRHRSRDGRVDSTGTSTHTSWSTP